MAKKWTVSIGLIFVIFTSSILSNPNSLPVSLNQKAIKTTSNGFLAPASYMPHIEGSFLQAYYTVATDLLKKQSKFSKIFTKYNQKKITATIYMFKAISTGLKRVVKMNKFMAKAYDTTNPDFYASNAYKEYRKYLKDTSGTLAQIRDVFGRKDMSFTYQELFGDGKNNRGIIDRMVDGGLVHDSKENLIEHIKNNFSRHQTVGVPTYFGEINFYRDGDLIRIAVDQLIPTDLNSFLKRSSNYVMNDIAKGGRRSSPYQTRIVMGHKKPDSDAVISSIVKSYMSQYLDSSKGYLSRVNIPVLQGEPNTETQFILKNNGVNQDSFVFWDRIMVRLKLMMNKLSLKVDTADNVFDDVKYKKLIELAAKKQKALKKDNAEASNSWFLSLFKNLRYGDFTKLEERYLNILAKKLLLNPQDNKRYIHKFVSTAPENLYDIVIQTLKKSKDIELLSIIRDLDNYYFTDKRHLGRDRTFRNDLMNIFDTVLAEGYPILIKDSKLGKIERTTWKNRLSVLQGVLADNIKKLGLSDSLNIIDVGCSSGITTADMSEILTAKGVNIKNITGTDIAMEYFEVTDKNGNKVFLDAFGNLLQIIHGGKVYPHSDYNLRTVFANVFEKNDIIDVKTHNVVSPDVKTKDNEKLSFGTGDIYGTYDEKVDVITVFDVLKIYYNKEQREAAIIKMGNNLKEGGILMHGNRYTNGYTSYGIYQRKGDKLILIKRSGHRDDNKRENVEIEMESELERTEDIILSRLMPTGAREIDLKGSTAAALQTPVLTSDRVVSYIKNNYESKRRKTSIGLTDHHMYEPDKLKEDEENLKFLDGFEDHHPIKESEKELFDKYLPKGWDKDPAYNFEAVGCTSTLLAEKMLKDMPLLLTTQIANLLLSAILSDTMGFYAPTTTKKDFDTALVLAKIAGVNDIEAFFAEQSKNAYTIKGRDAASVIFEDYKESYTPEAGLAQIFVNGFEEFDAIAQDSYKYYKELLSESNQLRFIALTVTDAKTKDSRLYMVVKPEAGVEVDMMMDELIHYPAISVAIINSDALRPFAKGELGLEETVDRILDYFTYDANLDKELRARVSQILTDQDVELYMLPVISQNIYELLISDYEGTTIDIDKIKDIVYSLSRSESLNRDGFKEFYLNLPGTLSRKKEIAPPVVSFYERLNSDILPKFEEPSVNARNAIAQAA